jgi:PAS domain S-box-containing protein
MGLRVGEVSRRTGVGVSALRAWESRYGFLEPQRSPAGHRLYDETDVERVKAVVRLVAAGLTLPAAIARVASADTAVLPTGEAETLLYNQILQAVSQGIWLIREGQTRYVNRRMAELMGYTIDALAALDVRAIFEPDELPLVRDRTEQVRAGQRLHFTQHVRRSDGTTFLAEVKTTPLFNQAGRYDGAIALVDDVTESERTQREAQLRVTLLDSIGEAVTASTVDGTVVYVNAAAERLFRWRAADVIGRHSRNVFPTPPEAAEHVARVNQVLLDSKPYTGRFKMLRNDGTEFVAHLTSVPARDKQGVHVGFVGVITDQTERDRRDRRQLSADRQSETLALLGAEALRQRASDAGTTEVITEAVAATRRLLRADGAFMLDVTPGASVLRVRAASPGAASRPAVPAGSGSFAGYIALAGKVTVVHDADHEHRFDADTIGNDGAAASAIGAPIFGPEGTIGVLIAESSALDHFGDSDAHFLQGIANVIGTALLA